SYASFVSANLLGAELERLRNALHHAGLWNARIGGRQHYLRWENPTTWRCWDQVGLDYDSTLGFADRVGFRCSTSREYPVFDLLQRRQLRLRERPLIAMDVSMVEYMGLSAPEISQVLRSLWSTISRVGGTLEVLIHPSNPMALWMAQRILELNRKPNSAPAVESTPARNGRVSAIG
ncbi:MAG TPA: hypothetical protein VHI52_10670, partial [Verrucomicrobiae bacterium]|nr:hypothetical protein [Verrucomicrobiae bacterium]